MTRSYRSHTKDVDHQTALRVVTSLLYGPLHFCQIERATHSRNPQVMSRVLQKLQRDNLITREVVKLGPPASVRYSLTDLGVSLGQSASSLIGWLDQHRGDIHHARASAYAEREAAATDMAAS